MGDEATIRRIERGLLCRRALMSYGVVGALALLTSPAEAAGRFMRERQLTLVNRQTGERLREVYWAEGKYNKNALKRIDWLLRDVHVNRTVPTDRKLLDVLAAMQQTLKPREPMNITSGYRTAETQQRLADEGYDVGDNSMHLLGKAVDLHVPGVSVGQLRKVALSLRAGGVGSYPQLGFVHVDTGPMRTW